MTSAAGPLVEHFFRHESANLVAVLVRAFGVARFELVEDMVQSAMLEAMHTWKHRGVPAKPAAWIHAVAKRRILDALRRERAHEQALAFAGQTMADSESLLDEWLEEDRLPDSLLRMIFVCCHPELDRASQIALTLKTLGGFGIAEIARALLNSKEAVKKRIQRARGRLAELEPPLDLPPQSELQTRLSSVHDVLYLMFNEGYSTSRGVDPIRTDLCEEAARLCHLLCEHGVGSRDTHALLALMLYHAARLDSRIDDDGAVVLLEDQDRSRWDGKMIMVAEQWLLKSSPDDDRELSRFHLEAAIARHHCMAKSVAETDWPSIVSIYDRLLERQDSPVYRLNREIARAESGDADTALRELDALRGRPELADYFLLDCARARILEAMGRPEEGLACYEQARARGVAEHEDALLSRKIERLGARGADREV